MSDERPTGRRTVLKAAGGLAGLAAVPGVAAGQEGTGTPTGTPQEGPLDKRIGMITTGDGGSFYTVPFRWVEPGTTVIWQHVAGGHSTTAYAGDGGDLRRIPEDASGWDSGVLSESGATFSMRFDVPGVYDYYCTPHEGLGMVGRLVVGSPDLSTEPAMAEPGDAVPSQAGEALSALNTVTRVMFG